MEVPIPLKFESIFRICLVLTFVSAFAIFFIGHADSELRGEAKVIEKFLEAAADLQPNFEKSLTMYTENTQETMDYLELLRPEDENGYIQFISTVENLGQTQGVNLSLQILDGDIVVKDETGSHYIDYKVQFYGREDQVLSFLSEMEALPYFTRVMDIHFQSFEFIEAGKVSDVPNVTLTLRLYVK